MFLVSLVSQSIPSDFSFESLGVFGIALAIAYYLLMRSDKQLHEEKLDTAKEIETVRGELKAERLAHEETRKLLLKAISDQTILRHELDRFHDE